MQRAAMAEERGEDNRWWEGVTKREDVKEALLQMKFSWPMILTNVAHYCIPLISVMFAGHLGELKLAGATLANTWATVSGFAVVAGLSGALETLCGQAYGAKMYQKMGMYLQASMLVAVAASSVIAVFWWFTEDVLIALHQEQPIAKAAAVFIRPLIPGLFASALLECLLRFSQTQSVVLPLAVCSLVPLVLHVPITYLLVHRTGLVYAGAAAAASVSLWISFFMLFCYVVRCKKFKETWQGFSSDSFGHVLGLLRLAIPSAIMLCLEFWAFDIITLLAGLMPDSGTKTSIMAMCVNTISVSFFITFGFSAVVSTRVANELGSGNVKKAKNAVKVASELALVLASIVVLLLIFGRRVWATFFSSSPEIITEFAAMVPLLAVTMFLDTVQGVLSGVARGCGWQRMGAWTNLGSFYVVGMPIAIFLGFVRKLYSKGLWMGLICGLLCQASTLLIVTLRTNWETIHLSVDRKQSLPV
ncbi:protein DETOXIFICATION 19-like [Wolffia australiana]